MTTYDVGDEAWFELFPKYFTEAHPIASLDL